jgi:excisionase family DNA binding protein
MKLITTNEAAERLGVTVQRVHALIRDGRLPAERLGRDYVIKEEDLALVADRKPGRPTFGERLKAIAAEILEELSDQYVNFNPYPPAQDSNDWHLTYRAHSGGEVRIQVIRRAGQTDDEVKEQIRAQLLPKADGPKRASKKAAKKAVKK